MQAKRMEREMQTYFTQLNTTEQKSVIQMLKTFLQKKSKEPNISIEDYNKDIDEAMAEIARGAAVSHEEVLKMAKSW